MSGRTRPITRPLTRPITRALNATELDVWTPMSVPGIWAWYRFNRGITQAGGFASQWDDATGNGHHVTQATGAQQFAVLGDGTLRGDGVDDSMASAAGGLVEPATYFVRGAGVTWTVGDVIVDGTTSITGQLKHTGVTPQIAMTTDNVAFIGPTAGPALGVNASIACQFNGASSLLQIDLAAPITGALVADAMGGIRIGARAAGTNAANFDYREVIVYSGTLLSQADINRIQAYLATI